MIMIIMIIQLIIIQLIQLTIASHVKSPSGKFAKRRSRLEPRHPSSLKAVKSWRGNPLRKNVGVGSWCRRKWRQDRLIIIIIVILSKCWWQVTNPYNKTTIMFISSYYIYTYCDNKFESSNSEPTEATSMGKVADSATAEDALMSLTGNLLLISLLLSLSL